MNVLPQHIEETTWTSKQDISPSLKADGTHKGPEHTETCGQAWVLSVIKQPSEFMGMS
jgi:hypothetical protein